MKSMRPKTNFNEARHAAERHRRVNPAFLKLSPAMARWINAPGVRTGFYAWGKSDGEIRAHAYRTGTRTVQGLCGYAFKRKVCTPELTDEECPGCAVKCQAMEVTLLGLGVDDKEAAVSAA